MKLNELKRKLNKLSKEELKKKLYSFGEDGILFETAGLKDCADGYTLEIEF